MCMVLGLNGASAAIISVSGQIEVLPTPPTSVAPGALESDDFIRVFLELEAVELSGDVMVNVLPPATTTTYHPDRYDPDSVDPGVIPAGTVVSSYLFHFDAVTGGSTIGPGEVTFCGPMLGVIVFPADLDDTDAPLGAPGTTYGPYSGNRGLGLNGSSPDDVITLSGDGHTLTIDNLWVTGSYVDQLRVIINPLEPGGDDCNTNGIPDACEPDCNTNGIADECDLRDDTSQDCQTNGIPDECEPDCNTNDIPDDCDIRDGTSQDCNANAIPDDCDIAAGTSEDVDTDGVPDECGPLRVDDDAPLGGDGLTWSTAYRYLQDALHEAADDPAVSEIRVAGGTYRPDQDEGGNVTPGDRQAVFPLLDGLVLAGGYAGLANPGDPDDRDIELFETVLSGDLDGDDGPDFGNNDENSYHVVTGSGTDATAVLGGFTISGGNTGTPWLVEPMGGAGLYNEGGSPTVTDCTFSGNLGWFGGGMYNLDDSNPAVTDCTFTGNTGWFAGGMFNEDSSPTVIGCTFSNNVMRYDGGAMYNYAYDADASPVLSDCVFSDNSGEFGGAMVNSGLPHLGYYCSPTLINCLFTQNSAGLGGAMFVGLGTPTLINCAFVENGAVGGDGGPFPPDGGGIYNCEGTLNLINCAFSFNETKASGGGVYLEYDAGSTLTNCTFYGNSAHIVGGGMSVKMGSQPTLTNCTFARNSAGLFGGGIYNAADCDPTLTNCLLWGNTGAPSRISRLPGGSTSGQRTEESDQIYGGSPVITFTCIQGLDEFAGNGNIGDAPLLEGDGVHLCQRSPCRNAGDPDYLPDEDETDIDGEPRMLEGRVDIGADEVLLELLTPEGGEPL